MFEEEFNINGQEEKRERPIDWRLTSSDLIDELKSGLRKLILPHEIEWAREYERSLIPSHYRFPRKGDIYEAKQDLEVQIFIDGPGQYQGSSKATLLSGERIRVESDVPEEKPLGVAAIPVSYKDLESRMVPAHIRQLKGYQKFYMSIDTSILNEQFNLITENRGL